MPTFSNIKTTSSQKISFTINDYELCIVNALRRIVLAEIPNVAFYFDPIDIDHNDIKINKNTCALHNEFLAHRISLVPLCFSENEISEFDASKFKFILKKQNTTFEPLEVTTKDFDIVDENGKKYPESLKERVLPKNLITGDYILITKLKPNLYDDASPPRGEAIDIECFPTVNIAQKHCRWCPVSQCCFTNTIDQQVSNEHFEELVSTLETSLGRKLTKEEKTQKMIEFNSLEVYRCFKKNKYDEANSFDFKIESECNLRPAYLFFKAIQILIQKLINLNENIVQKKGENVKIVQLSGVDNYFQIEIRKEDYTLLNVLQNMIYNICFREKKSSENPLEYIGYYQPHPLDDCMVLKLKFKDFKDETINEQYIVKFMGEMIEEIIKRQRNFATEWLQVPDNLYLKSIKDVQMFNDTL
jgi:DNA-directed RNA polymerase subunit L/uncharacterized protein YaaR (DUF327 family)